MKFFLCSDMLQTIVNLRSPTATLKTASEIFVLQNLAIALPACIYQSLCDSNSFNTKHMAAEGVCSPRMESLAKLNADC